LKRPEGLKKGVEDTKVQKRKQERLFVTKYG